MSEDREGFLGRWSRLKQARQSGAADSGTVPEPAEDRVAPAAPAEPVSPGQEAEGESDEAALELPPIESLDKDSDFTVFLKDGVPEELRRQALRKLWVSDPVLANLDGLLEYGEDFNEPWRTTSIVKTLYQVGKGMPGPATEEDEEVGVEVADESAQPASPDDSAPASSPPDEPDGPSEPDGPDEPTEIAAETEPRDTARSKSDTGKPAEDA